MVQNGDATVGHRLSAGSIELNGVEVVFERDFNQQVGHIERTVVPQASNNLTIKLKSGPGDFITVSIVKEGGGDTTPPSLSITPADGSIVNTTMPTIEIAYSDAESGVNLSTFTVMIDGYDYMNLFMVTVRV